MAVQMLGIKTKFTDDQGRPLVGGSVHTYYAGTSLPQDTFSDPELTVPNTNPVKLDDTGSANIFLKGTYRVRVFDKNGVFVEEQDNVDQLATVAEVFENKGGLNAANERIDALTSEVNSVKEKTIIVESIADLPTINNPKDGLRVYVKSYHEGVGRGGGSFTYDSSRLGDNDGGTVIDGWVREYTDSLSAECFGVVFNSEDDQRSALQNAIDVTASLGIALTLPEGVANLSGELVVPSNSRIVGAGKRNTTLKLLPSVSYGCVVTTLDTVKYSPSSFLVSPTEPVSNVVLDGFTIDGNYPNRTTSLAASHDGAGVCIRYARDVVVRNILSKDTRQHGFDVTAAFYNGSYPEGTFSINGSTERDVYLPFRSERVLIENCEATAWGDDGFTVHHSDKVVIQGCYAYDSHGQKRSAFTNSNGFEIDEGSADVVVRDSTAKHCCAGFQYKGHEHTASASRGLFENCLAIECITNFEVRMGWWSASNPITNKIDNSSGGEATTHSVSIRDCTSINPVGTGYGFSEGSLGFPSKTNDRGWHLNITDFNSVTVEGFTCLGKDSVINTHGKGESGPPRKNPIVVKYSNNIRLSRLFLDSVKSSDAVIGIGGNSSYPVHNIGISGVHANECTGYVVHTDSTVNSATVDNVIAYTSDTGKGGDDCPVISTLNIENTSATVGLQYSSIYAYGAYTHRVKTTYPAGTTTATPQYLGTVGNSYKIDNLLYSDALSLHGKDHKKCDVHLYADLHVSGGISSKSGHTILYNQDTTKSYDKFAGLAVYTSPVGSNEKTEAARVHLCVSSGGGVRYFSPDSAYSENVSLGWSHSKWQNIYAVNSTINTSDIRYKTDIEELDEKERQVAVKLKGLVRKFKWKNSVEDKGGDARIHMGVMAQDVKEAFEAEGLDAHKYAMFCYDEWDKQVDGNGNTTQEAGSSYSIRYTELLAFIISAL